MKNTTITYKDAGVDLELADQSVKTIGALAKSTFNPNVLSEIGLFGGFFKLDLAKYFDPVLVSSIDGVGTKLKIALALDKHESIGEDLVNHCVNDIMTSGADPLFFLDYIGTQQLSAQVLQSIIAGMARGCRNAGCALIGGETAEMPGFYAGGEYDLVGAIVGAVDRTNIINGSSISVGDILIGLPSNGLHTNGYSLARKVLLDAAGLSLTEKRPDLEVRVGEELLKVHKCYKTAIVTARNLPGIAGISHITGGGIEGNTRRLLATSLSLSINWSSWEIPPIFGMIQKLGNIPDEEMRRVFNLGIGLIFIVKPDTVDEVISSLNGIDEKPVIVGEVVHS